MRSRSLRARMEICKRMVEFRSLSKRTTQAEFPHSSPQSGTQQYRHFEALLRQPTRVSVNRQLK
jgi:hypothetical protein